MPFSYFTREKNLQGTKGQTLDISKIPDDASDMPTADETPGMQPHHDENKQDKLKNLEYNAFDVYLLRLLRGYFDEN